MSHLDWKPLSGKTNYGSDVVLRRLRMSDLDQCGQWINNPELRQLLRVDYPLGEKEEQAFLERATAPLPPNPSELALAIWIDNLFIGTCGLHSISQRHRHAEIGILIGDASMRGKGIGLAVYELLHHFAFTELNLKALKADVYSHNERSQKLHKKMGYSLMGRIPQWYFKAGAYRDLLLYHLSREKWIPQV